MNSLRQLILTLSAAAAATACASERPAVAGTSASDGRSDSWATCGISRSGASHSSRNGRKRPRYGAARPLFVLTSRGTFSAAEGFAYNLQALGRAVP